MLANLLANLPTTLLKSRLLPKQLKLPRATKSKNCTSFLTLNMCMIAYSSGCQNGNKMDGRRLKDSLSKIAQNWNVWKVSCLDQISNGVTLKVIVATMEMTRLMNLPNVEQFSNKIDILAFLHFIAIWFMWQENKKAVCTYEK